MRGQQNIKKLIYKYNGDFISVYQIVNSLTKLPANVMDFARTT